RKRSAKSSRRSRRSSELAHPMASQEPRLTLLGKIAVLAVVAASAYGAWYYLRGRGPASATPDARGTVAAPADPSGTTTIGVAYGTEKQRWFEWAVGEFAKAREGRGIKVQLLPMGSLEGAQAVANGDQRITVWSPASSLYKSSFVADWTLKHSKTPILR